MQARDAFLTRHPETAVSLNGRDWGVIDTGGTGPAMLFLPGTLGRADIFFQQIEALAPRRRVLAVSYPQSAGVADWTGDLALLLDQRGIAQVAVLGSSLGGFVAQHLAAAHPARVSHLFAANTLASVEGVSARPPYSSDLWQAPIAELRAGFAAGLTAWAETHADQRDTIALLLAEAAGRIPEGQMRARLDAIKTGPALPAAGSTPCTVIDSADDPLIPPPMRAAVRARLAGAETFHFRAGGHFPYLVRPALYTAILRARLGLAAAPEGWERTETGWQA